MAEERIHVDPYGFVRLAGKPERLPPTPHRRYSGACGRLLCTLTAKTPIFVYDPRFARDVGGGHEEARFPVRQDGSAFIPGTSLKGLLRSVVEAVAPGCFTFTPREYGGERRGTGQSLRVKVPPDFLQCDRYRLLCPACRLFGCVNENQVVHAGQVTFSDAVAPPGSFELEPKMTLDVLSSPKPEARPDAYVVRDRDNQVRGRKFYRHRLDGVMTREAGKKDKQNKTVTPVSPDSTFTFQVGYFNLRESELRVLLYSLALEQGLWHKIGMGKPLGMGSAEIRIVQWQRVDPSVRYRTLGGGSDLPLEGPALEDELATWVRQYRDSRAQHLEDLREVWRHDHSYDVHYATRS